MRRSGKKRKPVETLLDYEEFGELTSEIKPEPTEIQFLDDTSLLVSCCCLCKTSSNNLAIFSSRSNHDSDIVNKIHSCSGLEISLEANPDAHICRDCLHQLNGHYAFQKQALKCNEYDKNQMAEAGAEFDILPEEIRVCRFCLKIGKKLLDMYPGGESPEYDLLQKIRECLAIEVNSWDPVTKICRNCIESVDNYFEFRIRYLPTSEHITDEIWRYGPSGSAKRIKQENEDANKQNLGLSLSASGSDCSLKENEHIDSTFAKRQKRAAMRPELLQIIGAEADGKNFTVLSEDDEQMKVIFDDQLFRFHSERENGSSLWTCEQRDMRRCKMKLEIDVGGTCATLLGGAGSHSHSPVTAKLMQCPLGKGMTELYGNAEPFYMFCRKSMARSLIIQGFLYYLHRSNRGVDSVWYCVKRRTAGCKAKLLCYGIFHETEIEREHNHNELSDCDIKTILLQYGIDATSTDAISKFQNVHTVEKIIESNKTPVANLKEKARIEMKTLVKTEKPQIFQLLKQDDTGRNFEVTKTGAKLTVVQDSYEYRYFGELSNKCTIWKCAKNYFRACKVLAKISANGKHLEIFKGKHSHGTAVEEIFHYPLGKRMIGQEPLWLLNRVTRINGRRFVIYRDHSFHLRMINRKEEVVWKCGKISCRALMYTKGNFQELILRNDHSHEKLPKSMVTELINGNTSRAYHLNKNVEADNLHLKTKKAEISISDNLLFQQKLLSYPSTKTRIWDEGENEYETLYILKQTKKNMRRGFVFRRNKFHFSSVDQNGTSRWICTKFTDDERTVRCYASVIVEGIFETILIAKQHTHEMMSESKMEILLKRYVSLSNSSEEKVENLNEIPNQSRQTGNILSILTRHDPERNFTVARAKTRLFVNYEGEEFRLKSRDSEGISTWSCCWLKIRKCTVSLRMSADGKQVAYLDPQKPHRHTDEQIGVFLQAPGKGQIYDKDNKTVLSYWLFSYQSEFRSGRGIIYQGNKYMLTDIANNGVSVWRCRKRCKVFVCVEGTFEAISGKLKHKHARLTDDLIKDLTGQPEVDTDLLIGCEALNTIVPASYRPLRSSAMLKIMSLDDPDRNFQIKVCKEEMKVIQEGYGFNYRSSTPSHTLWKCIYSGIHQCPVTLLIDNACKQACQLKPQKHTHSLEPSNLYDYPLGEGQIMDMSTESKKPFWFLMQPTFIRPKPFIIYEEYRYDLKYIGETRNHSFWSCRVIRCTTKLVIKGLYESVVVKGSPHTHPPLAADKKSKLIRLFET